MTMKQYELEDLSMAQAWKMLIFQLCLYFSAHFRNHKAAFDVEVTLFCFFVKEKEGVCSCSITLAYKNGISEQNTIKVKKTIL